MIALRDFQPDASLLALCGALRDETLGAAELAELEQRLLEDEQARLFLVDFLRLHAMLERYELAPLGESPELAAAAALPARPRRRGLPLVRSVVRFFNQPAVFSLLVATLVTISLLLTSAQLGVGPPSAPRERAADSSSHRFAARLSGAAGCVWADPAAAPFVGAFLVQGRQLRLEAGVAEVTFQRGAKVLLEGPAHFILQSSSEGKLEHGRLAAEVPATAKGFAVVTPEVTVVDLGTEFGIDVSEEGATLVHVFSGQVIAMRDEAEPVPLQSHQAFIFHARTHSEADPEILPHFVREMPPDTEADYVALISASRPSAYWRLEEAGSAAEAMDSSGNGATAAYHGAVQSAASLPALGSAALLQGGGCRTEHLPAMNLRTGLSVELWLRRQPQAISFERLVESDWRRNGFVLAINPPEAGEFKLTPGHVIFGQGRAFAESPFPVTDGRWHHIVAVAAGGRGRVYVDGQPGQTVRLPAPHRLVGGILTLGTNAEGTMPLLGELDEVAIYARALSEREIQTHFEAGRLPANHSDQENPSSLGNPAPAPQPDPRATRGAPMPSQISPDPGRFA